MDFFCGFTWHGHIRVLRQSWRNPNIYCLSLNALLKRFFIFCHLKKLFFPLKLSMNLFTYVLHPFSKLLEAYTMHNASLNYAKYLLKLIRIQVRDNMAKIPRFCQILGFQNFQKPIFLSLLVSLTPNFFF